MFPRLIAGSAGIPVGYVLHLEIMQFVGQVAGNTAIPAGLFDLNNYRALLLLAMTGVAV